MAIRVGRWDCPTCGHKGNLGPETRCKNCGAPRPEKVKFYLPEDAEVVEDEKRRREAQAGVDWVCGHCAAQNKAGDTLCYSCGNPRDAASEDVDLEQVEYDTEQVPRQGPGLEEAAGEQYRRARIRTEAASKRKRRRGLLGLILSSPILAGILFFLLKSFPQTVDVEVVGFIWERSIQFEHYEAVQEEAWEVPSQAFQVSSFKAIHHYDKVFRGYETRTRDVRVKVGEESYVCGQRDLGNGYFEDRYCTRPIYETREETYKAEVYEDVPVYATKYRYTIMRWVRKQAYFRKISGTDQQARWPEAPTQGDPDTWRQGPKDAVYYVTVLENDGDKHTEEVGYQYWQARSLGEKLPAEKSRLMDIYYGLKDPAKNR